MHITYAFIVVIGFTHVPLQQAVYICMFLYKSSVQIWNALWKVPLIFVFEGLCSLCETYLSHLINIFNCFWLFFFNQNGMEWKHYCCSWFGNFNYKFQWKLITCSMKGTLYALFPSRERYFESFFLVSSPFWTRSVSCCNPLLPWTFSQGFHFSYQLPWKKWVLAYEAFCRECCYIWKWNLSAVLRIMIGRNIAEFHCNRR